MVMNNMMIRMEVNQRSIDVLYAPMDAATLIMNHRFAL
jgi:hypothetical protein